MGYEENMVYAVGFLKGELEGITEYTKAIEMCDDADLRKIMAENVLAEKRHAHALLSYINSKAEYLLK